METYSKLPVVDFASFRTGSAEDRKRIALEVDDALRTAGFFYLRNHGIPQPKIQDLFEKVSAYLYPFGQYDTDIRSKRASNSSISQSV
jgi:isopenicillin N synthase-like dioxygenase